MDLLKKYVGKDKQEKKAKKDKPDKKDKQEKDTKHKRQQSADVNISTTRIAAYGKLI